MRSQGRSRPRTPLISSYIRRRGTAPTILESKRRIRALELARRTGGSTVINRIIGAAPAAGGGGVGAHALLSATHTDTLPSAVSRGSLITGDGTPAYAELVLGAAGTFPRSDGVDLLFSAIQTSDLPNGTDTVTFTANIDSTLSKVGIGSGAGGNFTGTLLPPVGGAGFTANRSFLLPDATGVLTLSPHGASEHGGNIFPGANQDLGAFYLDIDDIAVPANPGAGVRRLFTNTATGELSVRTSAGATVSLEGGGGGAPHNLLDGVTHPDTVAQAPTRGSMVYGNSTPDWDELVIGPANAVLFSNAVDVAWSTGPTLAANTTFLLGIQFGLNQGIKDNAAGQRMRFSDGSFGLMNIYLAGLVRFDGTVGIDTNAAASVSLTVAPVETAANWTGGAFNPTMTQSVDAGTTLTGLTGKAILNARATATSGSVFGLNYEAHVQLGGVGAVIASAIAMQVRVRTNTFTGTITNMGGIVVVDPLLFAGTPVATTITGIDVLDQGHASSTDVYAYRARAIGAGTNRYLFFGDDITAGTIARVLQLGGAANSGLLECLGSGEWDEAVDTTPVQIAEGDGAGGWNTRQVVIDVADGGGHVSAGAKVLVL